MKAEDVAGEILNKYSNDYSVGDIPDAAALIQSFADSQTAPLLKNIELLSKELETFDRNNSVLNDVRSAMEGNYES